MTQSPQTKPKRQRRKEKLTDKEQSERFIETARNLDLSDIHDDFEAKIVSIILQKLPPTNV